MSTSTKIKHRNFADDFTYFIHNLLDSAIHFTREKGCPQRYVLIGGTITVQLDGTYEARPN